MIKTINNSKSNKITNNLLMFKKLKNIIYKV